MFTSKEFPGFGVVWSLDRSKVLSKEFYDFNAIYIYLTHDPEVEMTNDRTNPVHVVLRQDWAEFLAEAHITIRCFYNVLDRRTPHYYRKRFNYPLPRSKDPGYWDQRYIKQVIHDTKRFIKDSVNHNFTAEVYRRFVTRNLSWKMPEVLERLEAEKFQMQILREAQLKTAAAMNLEMQLQIQNIPLPEETKTFLLGISDDQFLPEEDDDEYED